MAAVNVQTRFKIPEKLEIKETAESLAKWISDFKVYAQRDPTWAPFLTETWDFNDDDMGFTDPAGGVPEGQLSAAEKGRNCKLFLAHLTTFLKRPYYNNAIEERTTSIESVWKLLRRIYNVELLAESLLDIGDLTYDKSES